MRVLFSTCSAAHYMAPPQLADEQINCGPYFQDAQRDGRFLSLATPKGEYDLAAIAARLPADQQPDVVVCLVDASRLNQPKNLGAFKCPKVLLVADTHHLNLPILSVIGYAASEPFDRIVLLYDRHHASIFRAAGLKNLFWFPGLTFPHADSFVQTAPAPQRRQELAFVGQSGKHHPRRTGLFAALQAAGLPFKPQLLNQRAALSLYGSTQLGLNLSLNGDLNLRVFEILAGGSLLITDRLAPQSGFDHLLAEGRNCVGYGDERELIAKVSHYLANPAEARPLADAGRQWFLRTMHQSARQAMFRALAIDGLAPAPFPLTADDPVAIHFPDTSALLASTHIYEGLQEMHRTQEEVSVALCADAPAGLAGLCSTLPRLGFGPVTTGTDFVVTNLAEMSSVLSAAPARIWCWDGAAEAARLAPLFAGAGYAQASPELTAYCRMNSVDDLVTLAGRALEASDHALAAGFVQAALARDGQHIEALLVAAGLALQTGDAELARGALDLLRATAPGHARITAIENQFAAQFPRESPAFPLLQQAREAVSAGQPLVAARLAQEALKADPKSVEACVLLGETLVLLGQTDHAATAFRMVLVLRPRQPAGWVGHANLMLKLGRTADALNDLLHAASLAPFDLEIQRQLARVASDLKLPAIARSAADEVLAVLPHDNQAAQLRQQADETEAALASAAPEGYDLLLTHVEISRLHGTGVLLQRFFSGMQHLVSLRSQSHYAGKTDLDALHLVLDVPDLGEAETEQRIRRLLGGRRIRRILCIPYYPADFTRAALIKQITGAPLCAYVMDDQTLHANAVPAATAARLFAAADLRLAISPEMAAAYAARFGTSFTVLPPILASTEGRVANHWQPQAGRKLSGALVGNIWSLQQFKQLRALVSAAGITLDWFGNASVPWLPKDPKEYEADGIFARGFIPESDLARRLAGYPFVVVPSGQLDGTEKNEWLTRLSLPSRMVFIFAQTYTPMLVLGHPATAAASFVRRLGLGACASYDPDAAKAAIAKLSDPVTRDPIVANARQAAPAFVLPSAGAWIWQSLAARQAQLLSLDPYMASTADHESADLAEICA